MSIALILLTGCPARIDRRVERCKDIPQNIQMRTVLSMVERRVKNDTTHHHLTPHSLIFNALNPTYHSDTSWVRFFEVEDRSLWTPWCRNRTSNVKQPWWQKRDLRIWIHEGKSTRQDGGGSWTWLGSCERVVGWIHGNIWRDKIDQEMKS